MMTPEEIDRLVEAHVVAEKAGDFGAAVAMYTDDIEHDVVGSPGGPLRGPDAAAHRYERLQKDMEQDEMVRTRTLYGEDFCVIEHEATWRVVGQFAGIPGHGRQVRFRMLHIFEFRDGRISRENVWRDSAGIIAQLNETPAPAAV
jgi:steroid delta-isomerase-like uncharacterized protein